MGRALRTSQTTAGGTPSSGTAPLPLSPSDGAPPGCVDEEGGDGHSGYPQLVLDALPHVLESLSPGPASLLMLLAMCPTPLSDAEIALYTLSPIPAVPAASALSAAALPPDGLSTVAQHPCQLSLDMCALYDHGLLHFHLLSGRHQVRDRAGFNEIVSSCGFFDSRFPAFVLHRISPSVTLMSPPLTTG